MSQPRLSGRLSRFLDYLAEQVGQGEESLPSLSDLSAELGVSISTLREELEVARALGLVEVKPRTGIKPLPYTFTPAVAKSLAYSVSVDRQYFRQFSDLRNHVEASYWYQAVSNLTPEDIKSLQEIITTAFQKMNADPIQIPHTEHRELHLMIYSRLENPYVKGILEAYWEVYEAVGLSVYEDRQYLERVWNYHQQMVEGIVQGDFLAGYQALIAHMDLLYQRDQNNSKIPFE